MQVDHTTELSVIPGAFCAVCGVVPDEPKLVGVRRTFSVVVDMVCKKCGLWVARAGMEAEWRMESEWRWR